MKFSVFDYLAKLEFVGLCFLVVVLGYFSQFITKTSTSDTINIANTTHRLLLVLPDYAVLLMSRLVPFSFFLSLLLVIGIITSLNKLMNLRDEMHRNLSPVVKASNPDFVEIKNERWQKIILHINSNNSSDWKLAILESDIILGEVLEKMGYLQPSIGEKLKAVEPSDFLSIESAWEAHKIRNAVAHEGTEFVISQREAKRVIGLYELVFREFDYI